MTPTEQDKELREALKPFGNQGQIVDGKRVELYDVVQKLITNLQRQHERELVEDYTHYYRTCFICGASWWGLHCPHDGYQNPCPSCNVLPTIAPSDGCHCEFVAPVSEITTNQEGEKL